MDFTLNNALSRPALIPLPNKQAIPAVKPTITNIKFGEAQHPGCNIITNSEHASAARFNTVGLDLSFQLRAHRKGKRTALLTLGRVWSPLYKATFKFPHCPSLSNQRLDLAAAYAGFKNGIVDRAAIAALSAVSQTFAYASRDMVIPDDSRAALTRVLDVPFEPTRLIIRMATLYAAAAAAEATGTYLRIHNSSDDNPPRHITQLSDWAVAVSASATLGEQPIYLGAKSAAEPSIYERICRVLALERPTFTAGAHDPPPTVTQLWPPIPKARAYLHSATDTTPVLSGAITSRDIAIFMSYWARLYGQQNELTSAVSFCMGQALRPAGTAVLGMLDTMLLPLPASAMQAAVASPLLQPTDVLTDEGIIKEFRRPYPQIVAGAMRACVFLSSHHAVTSLVGADWVGTPYDGDLTIADNMMDYNQPTSLGSAAANAALALASDVGWSGCFNAYWQQIGSNATRSNHYLPVEAEETLPFADGLPSNAAVLALLRPSALDNILAPNTPYVAAMVAGRASPVDALYSVLAQPHPAAVHCNSYNVLTQRHKTTNCKVRQSYRGVPSDGQFTSYRTETTAYTYTITFPDNDSVMESYTAHQRSESTAWYYEWNLPHSGIDQAAQYIAAGFRPEMPALTVPGNNVPTILVPQPTNKLPLPSREVLEELTDALGNAIGDIIEAHKRMRTYSGKQLEVSTYEETVRVLTGHITALDMGTLSMVLEPDEMRDMATTIHSITLDTLEWEFRDASREQLKQVIALARAHELAAPLDTEPPSPPDAEEILASADLLPFSATPEWSQVAAEVAEAATGLPDPDFHGLEQHPQQPPSIAHPAAAPTAPVSPSTPREPNTPPLSPAPPTAASPADTVGPPASTPTPNAALAASKSTSKRAPNVPPVVTAVTFTAPPESLPQPGPSS
jgi:hypothetical protein